MLHAAIGSGQGGIWGEGNGVGGGMGMIPLIFLVELIGVAGCLALIGDADARTIFNKLCYITDGLLSSL